MSSEKESSFFYYRRPPPPEPSVESWHGFPSNLIQFHIAFSAPSQNSPLNSNIGMNSTRPGVGPLEVLYSLAEAERHDLEESRAMNPSERMALIEELRRTRYGEIEAEAEASFPEVLEISKCPLRTLLANRRPSCWL